MTAVALLAIRQNVRNPIAAGLLTAAPVVLVFILSEALKNVFPGGRAFAFFTVLILTQATAFGAHLGHWGIHKHRQHATLARLRIAPMGALSFVVGTFAGSFLTLWAFLAIAASATVVLFGVTITGSAVAAIAVLGGGAAFAIALGMLVATVVESPQAALGVSNTLIPAVILASGGYVPIPESGFLFEVSRFSPLGWMNRSISAHLGMGETPGDFETVAIELGAAALLVAIAWMRTRRDWQ